MVLMCVCFLFLLKSKIVDRMAKTFFVALVSHMYLLAMSQKNTWIHLLLSSRVVDFFFYRSCSNDLLPCLMSPWGSDTCALSDLRGFLCTSCIYDWSQSLETGNKLLQRSFITLASTTQEAETTVLSFFFHQSTRSCKTMRRGHEVGTELRHNLLCTSSLHITFKTSSQSLALCPPLLLSPPPQASLTGQRGQAANIDAHLKHQIWWPSVCAPTVG